MIQNFACLARVVWYTEPTLQRLAALKPKTLAAMHGSTFVGDGEWALADLAQVMKEVLAGG